MLHYSINSIPNLKAKHIAEKLKDTFHMCIVTEKGTSLYFDKILDSELDDFFTNPQYGLDYIYTAHTTTIYLKNDTTC